MTRRDFCRRSGLLALSPFLPINSETPVIRPPGAGPDFASRCIRCGKCMEACPYNSIKMLGISAGALAHTPYVDPLSTPCYLCRQRGPDGWDRPLSDYLRCGRACPTGALYRIRNDARVLAEVPPELRMGVSVINRRLCLAWQYDACGECYYNCPLKDKALLDHPPDYASARPVGLRPYIDPRHCIGCGMCNFVCPVRRKIADAVMKRGVKLNKYEERYAAMVRNVIGGAGAGVKLPAARLIGKMRP